MSDPNDIFEVDTQEAVTWLGAVATLDEAHAAIRRRAPTHQDNILWSSKALGGN
jgi:hypothetical protein